MRVWRVMNVREFLAYLRGEIIRPQRPLKGVNRYKAKEGMCFFLNANNAFHWGALHSNTVIVCFEIDKSRLECSVGRYPDLHQLLDFDPENIVWCRECLIPAYSKKNARLIGWGVPDWKEGTYNGRLLMNGMEAQNIRQVYITEEEETV